MSAPFDGLLHGSFQQREQIKSKCKAKIRSMIKSLSTPSLMLERKVWLACHRMFHLVIMAMSCFF